MCKLPCSIIYISTVVKRSTLRPADQICVGHIVSIPPASRMSASLMAAATVRDVSWSPKKTFCWAYVVLRRPIAKVLKCTEDATRRRDPFHGS